MGEKAEAEEEEAPQGEEEKMGDEFVAGPQYTYQEMLTHLYELIEAKNPTLGTQQKYVLKPPQTVRVGSKKVAWVNFSEICAMMKRPTDHVVQFVLAEFGTEGSIAGAATSRSEGSDGQLILKGRYLPKHCESLLRKYIREYVTCDMCKSANTQLTKDSSSRLYTVTCDNCGAGRTAASIKSGYHAVTRGARRAAKQAKA
eukprot:NODE_4102_length_710_cov_768.725191.p1 GENE.NODE_4102_length_710_cov_768.725191~~NODE_4102_length_710_cov_768.725191.p1  ORF type:complete len:200 (+),score=78.44 NODE_4102_length_710_cov_768.725191:3-602(+)